MDVKQLMRPAAWIWCDDVKEVNQYARFRQIFTAESGKATLYICADTAYAAYVNGQYVPGFAYGDYPECRSVDVLELTPYLHAGDDPDCCEDCESSFGG